MSMTSLTRRRRPLLQGMAAAGGAASPSYSDHAALLAHRVKQKSTMFNRSLS